MGGVDGTMGLRQVMLALAVAAGTLTLLPAMAHGQEEVPGGFRTCPVAAPAAGFSDRADILEVHRANVDCAVWFEIVAGFADETYGPGLPVRRDQVASFLVRTLEAIDVELPPATQGRDFTDVAADSPHRDAILRLEATGIVRGGPLGRPASEFGPSLPVRRDQMAAFLDGATSMVILGFPSSAQDGARQQASPAGPFRDVNPDSVHATRIRQAVDRGLMLGFDDGTFRPAARTRRDHMASFMTRLLHLLAAPAEVEITDQTTETTTVGQAVTVTATVYTQYGTPVSPYLCPPRGVLVPYERCVVTFDTDAGTPQQQKVWADDDGVVEFTFTAEAPGPVTVTASILGPGGLYRAKGDTDTTEVVFAAVP